ncbi:MAG: hypothetical protein EHM81_03885 [Chloroflexi bacterium]|nr:MAG: hypothetical protein EHM81_03885 [Chloroflexota bacterium]
MMNAKKWMTLILFCLLVGLLAAPMGTGMAANSVLKPVSFTNITGNSQGNVGSLSRKDQSGTANNPSRFMSFNTPQVNYRGYRVYQLPTGVDEASIGSFQIKVNFKGPAYSTQRWHWLLYDWTYQKWVQVGNNKNATANVWSLLTFNRANVQRFISPEGQIRLRLNSSNATGNAKIDSESITLFFNQPPTLPPGSSVRFAVIGDYGLSWTPEADVAAKVKSWNPDFIITTGDNNYPDGAASTIDKNIGQYYHEFIYPYKGSYGAGATYNRFFPTLGNHDWHATGAKPYLDYFTLPGNERYYDFASGPVHFFALDSDPEEPDGNTSTSAQGAWLKNAMAAATEPWKIVYFHHAPYSSGAVHGSSKGMQWPFNTWGADAVMAGHEHIYERIMVGGIPYIVNGAGGGPLYDFDTPVAGSAVRYNADYGAMLVEATSTSITYQFITRTGKVIDTYTDTTP